MHSRRALAAQIVFIALFQASALPADGAHSAPSPEPTQRFPSESARLLFLTPRGKSLQPIREVLPGDRVFIRLENFPPRKKITVRATWAGCQSRATFESDASGNIDLSKVAPLEGSYPKADPDGLLWSMKCGKDFDEFAPHPPEIRFTAESDGKTLASGTLPRAKVPPGVRVKNVTEDGLVGMWYLPSGKGPFPVVITIGGSEGGIGSAPRGGAAHLAARGYAVLALGYFGLKGLPRNLKNIPVDAYFGKAIRWIGRQKEANVDQLAVWGISRGGELSLLLGTLFPQLKAVVAVVPSGVIWLGESDEPGEADKAVPAWTVNGKPLPYVGTPKGIMKNARRFKAPNGATAISYTPSFLKYLSDADAVAKARIPVETTKGAILMIGAEEDALWPSVPLSKIAWDLLKKRDRGDEFYPLPHSGHTIAGLFGTPTTFPFNGDGASGPLEAFGGDAEGIANAQRDALEKIDRFLDRQLKGLPGAPIRSEAR